MKKKARKDVYLTCDDPSIASCLKQGDVVRVTRVFKGERIVIDFIVKFFCMKDSYNDNWMVEAFTQQLNKALGKPKGFNLEETLVFNSQNMGQFSFCLLAYKRWNMSRVARGIKNNISFTNQKPT